MAELAGSFATLASKALVDTNNPNNPNNSVPLDPNLREIYTTISHNPHHNVYDIVLLSHENNRSDNLSDSPDLDSGSLICIATTHLFWADSVDAVSHHRQQAIQMALLTERIQHFLTSQGHPLTPVVIAGDFNASPRDAACELLRHGQVDLKIDSPPPNKPSDKPSDSPSDSPPDDLSAEFRIKTGLQNYRFTSVYAMADNTRGEADEDYSVVTDTVHNIDYIWYISISVYLFMST